MGAAVSGQIHICERVIKIRVEDGHAPVLRKNKDGKVRGSCMRREVVTLIKK